MRKIKYRKGRKVQPNALEYTGIYKTKDSEIQLFVYDASGFTEKADFKVPDLSNLLDPSKNNWLNVHGLNNIDLITAIGKYFTIDNYVLSDILNTTRRTKLEETNDQLFFNIKSILPSVNSDNINVDQISFLLQEGVLMSFQERRSDFFEHIRERIRNHSKLDD